MTVSSPALSSPLPALGPFNPLALIYPGALGSLDHYIQAVNRMPLLTQQEETALARRYQAQEDISAARSMVLSHLRLVVSISRHYLGYGLPQADLIQEGNIGLMKAVKRFNPDHGARLVSFAIQWIKSEMQEYIVRNWRLVKLATTKAQRKLFFNLRSLKSSDRTLTTAQANDIAMALNVKPEEVREMEMRLSGHDMTLEGSADDDQAFGPLDYLVDEGHEPTDFMKRRADDQLQSTDLQAALSNLDARSRDIVQSRWLADDKGKTLEDLALRYGVSAERIRQIEQRALKTLKTALSEALA